jgi:pyridoxal phosphate enzyme (YggS family)
MREADGSIAERYRQVSERVAAAALRAGRRPSEVTIVVAAKGFGAEALRQVVGVGARDVGENYVQEAMGKERAVGFPGLRWHMIGRLQRNKAKQVLRMFDLIHSLDRLELARALESAARGSGVTARCLIEVNLDGEPSKGGVPVDSLPELLAAVSSLRGVEVHGLMAIPTPGEPRESRRRFARLRTLRDGLGGLRLPHVELKELSMGMSADFEEAIEEGATFVRIGTAIFGPRSE